MLRCRQSDTNFVPNTHKKNPLNLSGSRKAAKIEMLTKVNTSREVAKTTKADRAAVIALLEAIKIIERSGMSDAEKESALDAIQNAFREN